MLEEIFKGLRIRNYHRNVKCFFLFAICYYSGLSLFSLLYNLYLLRLGYREDFIGRLAGMTPLASGLVAIPTGILSDRIGRKPFLIASAFLLGVSQLGLCLALRPVLMFSFAFLGGISLSFLYVVHVPFLAENSKLDMRGQTIALGFATQAVPRMLVSLVGGMLPGFLGYQLGISANQPETFRYVLLIGASVSFLSVFTLFGIRPKNILEYDLTVETRGDRKSETIWKLLIGFMFVSLFRGLSFGMTVPFFNVFFEEELAASTATIGTIFFLSQGLGVPSAIVAPSLANQFGARVTIVLFRLIGALCLGTLGGGQSLLLGMLVFFVLAAVDSAATPMEMTFATEKLPRLYWGRLQSFRVTGFQLFSAVGSICAGEMIVRVGYGPTWWVGALAILISGVVILIRFGWKEREPEKVK